jgi:hyperosmotically inducible periplasmic protein
MKKTNRKVLSAALSAVLAGMPVYAAENTNKSHNSEPAEGSDAWLSMKVKAALLVHRNVSAVRTKVDVKDGVVTLTGEAESQAEKDLATEYTKDVAGVKSVNNQMTIGKNANQPSMEERLDDAGLIAQIKMALLARNSASALRTNVDAKDGVVTLKGVAKNDAERQLATKIASDIKGVKNVINEMTIE